MDAIERPYGWISVLTGENASRGTTYTTVWSIRSHSLGGGLVAGTAVTPGIGGRLRRVAFRLVTIAGMAALAWLLSAMVNSGTASASQNTTQTQGTTDSANNGPDSGTSGGGLLGSLLGGLGNTVSGTLSNVTGTVTSVTTTVTQVTTGLLGTVTSGVGGVLNTVVTGVVAPATTAVSHTVGGVVPAVTTPSVPVAGHKPVALPEQHIIGSLPGAPAVAPAAVVVPPATPAPAAKPLLGHRVTSLVAQRSAVPAAHPSTLPDQPLPAPPAPQPAPAPAVPVSFASAGHGFHGPARHALGAYTAHSGALSVTALGVRSPDSAALAARHQGLPPTTPD